ncbi:MAG: hypothetical protein RLZZ01_324, partial [Actinomycetota bacterium]
MRIRHVLSTVGPSAPAELVTIQDLTLRSIERALRCAGDDLDVEVIAVRFPDEPVDREWLVDMPILERSVLDLGEFAIPRRLPLLSDVLAGFGDPADFDLAVYTNIDIAVQPYFYDLVADLRRRGDDAISITRRTVHPRYDGSTLAELSAAVGTHHPGDDCIVMASNLLASLRPTDVA